MDQYVNGHSTHRAEWRQKPERIRPREPKKDQSMIKSIYRVLPIILQILGSLWRKIGSDIFTDTKMERSFYLKDKTLDSDISMTDDWLTRLRTTDVDVSQVALTSYLCWFYRNREFGAKFKSS